MLALTLTPQAHAQYPYIVVSSVVSYNVTSNTVSGASSTAMDYNTQYWYQAYVEGHLKRNGSEVSSSSAYSGSSASSVLVNTQATGSSNQNYLEEGRHGVLPRYANTFGCNFSSYDAYGYSYLICDTPGSCFDYRNGYGSTQTVYAPYWTICWTGNPPSSGGPIRIGTTTTSLQTPTFSITLTNERISESLNNSNQNVLLGAPALIRAAVSPTGLSGSFTWVLTGPFTNDFSSADNSYKSFYWTEPGNKVITVSYAGVSASFNVAVQVPTLTSFQGTLGRNVVDRGSNCSSTFSRRQWVVRQFFYSPETFARFPGLTNPPGSPGFDPNVYNPAFVTACYVGLLIRNPDEQGYATWLNVLNQTGDYDHVLNGFLESPEFRARFGPVDPRY